MTTVLAEAEPSSTKKGMFMAEPVTPAATLIENKGDMKVKMELFIMKIQEEFCRALEAEEDSGMKFHVDRWTRPEGESLYWNPWITVSEYSFS